MMPHLDDRDDLHTLEGRKPSWQRKDAQRKQTSRDDVREALKIFAILGKILDNKNKRRQYFSRMGGDRILKAAFAIFQSGKELKGDLDIDGSSGSRTGDGSTLLYGK